MEVNYKMDLQELGCGGKDWIDNNNNIYLTAIGSSPGGSGFCHVYKKT
jgi:hypothetical protein